mgnify:CR=1 FL=1
MKIIIKTMETPEEIEGKSIVHWQTWREAYDDLLPAMEIFVMKPFKLVKSLPYMF